ncbi:MAG: hypothetical protein MEQ07_00070 [Aquimonas sp.]|nr:hypothetical protein [Aquimonas sp.]
MERLLAWSAALLALLTVGCAPKAPPFPESELSAGFSDAFDGEGPLQGWRTVRAEVLPDTSRQDGRYRAALRDNSNNRTLHFNRDQGRLDAKPLRFPFDVVLRNVGIGTLEDSQTAPRPPSAYIFAGLQVHAPDLEVAESAHLVVGHRGRTLFTVEGKNTRRGRSGVTDEGINSAPQGRADLRIVGLTDRSLRAYWQLPNPNSALQADNWRPYNGSGLLPGRAPRFPEWVYVGLITYAQGDEGLPFVGTADAIELVSEQGQPQ